MLLLKKITYWMCGWIGVGGGILMLIITGDVVIDQKVEFGQYLFRYRENPDEWVPVSRWLYTLDVAYGRIFIVLFLAGTYFIYSEFRDERDESEISERK